jgi:hypothetical protein
MMKREITQLSHLLDRSNPSAELRETESLFRLHYDASDFSPVRNAYSWIVRLFAGGFPGYRPCSTGYHDLGHTLDVLAASVRLIDGCSLTGCPLPGRLAASACAAALFHDTGYILENEDREGTGAKYTAIHVERSIEFVEKHAAIFGLPPDFTGIIARLIAGTSLDTPWNLLEFRDEEERTVGALVATADLLGQMADRVYLEKLLFLYGELTEAGIGGYTSELDLLRSTPGFSHAARERLEGPLMRVYRMAAAHFERRHGIARNLYLESMENQMEYLRRIISDQSPDFHGKLKRRIPRDLSWGRIAADCRVETMGEMTAQHGLDCA